MKKILYIGKADKISQVLKSALAVFKIETLLIEANKDLSLQSLANYLSEFVPEVIVWDYDAADLNKFDRFINFLSQDEATKHMPKIAICFEQRMKELEYKSISSDVVYFVKSVEVDDIVYYLKSILMPEKISTELAARAFFHNKINLFEAVKVKSLGRESAEIETNRKWESGSEIEIDLPGLSSFNIARKQVLEQRNDADIQSGFKLCFKINYRFDVNKIKLEERNNILTDLRYRLIEEKVDEVNYKLITDIDKKSKTISLFAKTAQVQQVQDDKGQVVVKALENCYKASLMNYFYSKFNLDKYYYNTVSIYDHALLTIDNKFDALKDIGTFINWRRKVIDANAEVKKDKPSVIVIDYSEENSFEQVKQVASATTQFRDYFPFILLFNFKEQDIDAYRHAVQYHYIIGTSIPINEGLICKLVKIYRDKRMSKEKARATTNFKQLMSASPSFQGGEDIFFDGKIYFPPNDSNGLVQYKHLIEIIWMTEFEMVFYSKSGLNPGDIYSVEIPTRFNIVIVPHIVGSREASVENCYRGLIHFIKENDKQIIRRFVNHVTKLSETRKTSIKEDEIKEIKRQYFESGT